MQAAFHFLVSSGLLPPVPLATPALVCQTVGVCPGGAGVSWVVGHNCLGAALGGLGTLLEELAVIGLVVNTPCGVNLPDMLTSCRD